MTQTEALFVIFNTAVVQQLGDGNVRCKMILEKKIHELSLAV